MASTPGRSDGKISALAAYLVSLCTLVVSDAAVSSGDLSEQEKKEILLTAIAARAEQVNDTAPTKIARGLRLDRARVEDGLVLVHEFTLVHVSSREVDVPLFQKTQQIALDGYVCASEGLFFLLKHGVVLVYEYSTSDGARLPSFSFRQEDC